MLNFYKTVDNRILKIDAPEPGCWISVVSPTEAEVAYLTGDLGVEPDFVRAALDEEESSRIESEEDQTLVIVDYPSAEEQTDENKTLLYTTLPMGIIITRDYVITVCLNDNLTIMDMAEGRVKGLQTSLKTRFLLLTLLAHRRALPHLPQADRQALLHHREPPAPVRCEQGAHPDARWKSRSSISAPPEIGRGHARKNPARPHHQALRGGRGPARGRADRGQAGPSRCAISIRASSRA